MHCFSSIILLLFGLLSRKKISAINISEYHDHQDDKKLNSEASDLPLFQTHYYFLGRCTHQLAHPYVCFASLQIWPRDIIQCIIDY